MMELKTANRVINAKIVCCEIKHYFVVLRCHLSSYPHGLVGFSGDEDGAHEDE